jgi:hypothetical protein
MSEPVRLNVLPLPQPTDSTCGPTCLQAVYRFYDDEIGLDQVIGETGMLEEGGTLAVYLGTHALRRGYTATIFTYNLHVFDPTWFGPGVILEKKLLDQQAVKDGSKLQTATAAYLEFLRLGGVIRMEVLTIDLIRRHLKRSVPVLTGLSSTFLYGEAREQSLNPPVNGRTSHSDDVGGFPCGHFVVLCGYDADERTVLVADPLETNPIAADRRYWVDIDRVFSAIMLGILTYDANLLIIQPPRPGKGGPADASTHRRG